MEDGTDILSQETYTNTTEGYPKEFNKYIPWENKHKIADSGLWIYVPLSRICRQ
jgi:hypothetical protein